jgi:hypothetical protein
MERIEINGGSSSSGFGLASPQRFGGITILKTWTDDPRTLSQRSYILSTIWGSKSFRWPTVALKQLGEP